MVWRNLTEMLPIEEQKEADSDFSTMKFSNSEESQSSLELSIELSPDPLSYCASRSGPILNFSQAAKAFEEQSTLDTFSLLANLIGSNKLSF